LLLRHRSEKFGTLLIAHSDGGLVTANLNEMTLVDDPELEDLRYTTFMALSALNSRAKSST
jgi:hypothetical protein